MCGELRWGWCDGRGLFGDGLLQFDHAGLGWLLYGCLVGLVYR